MSTAAPTNKPAASAGYDIARPLGQCTICGETIEPGAKFMAALIETPEGFHRADCSLACWEKFDRTNVIAHWQAIMPQAQQKKKLFVDDSVLCDLFERLADATEPARLNFRFVLGLILMRKRLVIYESTRKQDDKEIWTVRMKSSQNQLELVDPKLTEPQMREVSQQLAEILSQEL